MAATTAESYDTATDVEQRAADATAVFVRANQVSPDRNGTVRLAGAGGPRFCTPRDLQPGQQPEPFWEQPRTGFCTGFKVGPDLVATAGHCIKPSSETGPGDISCSDLRLVFGFRNTKARTAADRDIPPANVYRCVDVLAGHLDTEDWRIIRVDRPINAPQVTMRTGGAAAARRAPDRRRPSRRTARDNIGWRCGPASPAHVLLRRPRHLSRQFRLPGVQ